MRNRNKAVFSMLMLGSCLLFYGFFAIYDGAVICVDSPSYIHMESSREPFYPLLLATFRALFSFALESFYLEMIAYFQSILAALTTFSLIQYIRKEFNLSKIMSLFVLALPLAVSLLCRFIAKRESMYSNSILTEGIAISLFLLFFRFLLEYYFHQTKKSLICSTFIVFVLLSTRKQMAVSLFLLLLSVMYIGIMTKKLIKTISLVLALMVVTVGGSTALDLGYNYALRGETVTHSSDVRFITTIAFYTANREDAELIQDAKTKDLFLKIYDTCDESGYLKHSAGPGWSNRVSHFGDNYDLIQIDTMWPMVNEFVNNEYGFEEVELNVKADEIMKDINKTVLPHRIGSVIEVFLDNFRSGLVTTVAQRNWLLNIYSIIIYLIYLVALVCLWCKGKNSKIVGFAVWVLISIVLNVGLCSLVIFCQTRYTIYNMALFYISLLVMVETLIQERKVKGA